MKANIVSCLLAFLLFGCVEPYEPEVGDYDSTLVVDGLFSNSEYPSIVTLSRSFAYADDEVIYVEGANVVIEEEGGSQTELQEDSPGIYKTDPTLFNGEIGKSYRLLVSTPDGNQFESDWEVMKIAPPIGTIDVVYRERIPDDSGLNPIPTAEFYLNSTDGENNTRFYRWEFVETYQYLLSRAPVIRAEFGNPPARGNDRIIFITRDESEGSQCWKTEYSKNILVSSTENLTQDVIADFLFHTVDSRTPRLSNRYSLLTKQYAISEAYYEYLKTLEEINETTGTLFDPIPSEVFGNVRSSEDRDIPVLGYFGVAGVSEKRIFIDRRELPLDFLTPSGPVCTNDTIDLSFSELYGRTQFVRQALYDYLYPEPPIAPIGYLLTDPPCASCAASDATHIRPDFW